MTKHEREHLNVILHIMDGDECTCIDPPHERAKGDERGTDSADPAAHSQCCHHYLGAYLRNILKGSHQPDPDMAAGRERTWER